jgi:hypothetical protein
MANRARGEAKITLGGKDYGIALGLGALAELEDAFGIENFEDALNFKKLSARRLKTFLTAVLKGNGVDTDAPEVVTGIARVTVPDFMAFVGDLMCASGLSERPEADAGSEAPLAARKGGKRG